MTTVPGCKIPQNYPTTSTCRLAVLHGVAVCDGKVLLDPGVEFGHVADLGIIVEDDVGLLFRQKRIVLFKTRVAVGARDDGRLRDGQRAVCHQKAEAVLAWSTLLPA